MIPVRIRITEARAWARKYLIEASVAEGVTMCAITGINTIMFTSSPAQAINQEEEEMVIRVLKDKIDISLVK